MSPSCLESNTPVWPCGHSLGLRFPHRRRVCDRSGRGRRRVTGRCRYDINCGVRLMRSTLSWQDIKPHLRRLMDQLYANIPAGTGRGGKYLFSKPELRRFDGRRRLPFAATRSGDVRRSRTHGGPGTLGRRLPEYVSDRALERVPISAARWDRAITSWKSRSWTRCSTTRRRA